MLKTYPKKRIGIAKKNNRGNSQGQTPSEISIFSGFLTLQRLAGNQAVNRLVPKPGQNDSVHQPMGPHPLSSATGSCITVNSPGDKHEKEAERIEKQIMTANAPVASGHPHDGKSDGTPEKRHGPVTPSRSPLPHRGGGKKLDPDDRRFFEERFGFDFNAVRIHSDPSAAASARALASRAYTLGSDITFGANEYHPRTREGRRVIAHELAHVVQQTRGRGLRVSDGPAGALTPAPSHQAQRIMVATGDAAGFATLANAVIAVQFEVEVSSTGVVSIRSTDIQGPPTLAAQELLNVLRRVISDTSTTTIEFIHGTSSPRISDMRVMIGSYPQSKIDLDDIEQFGFDVGEGISAGSALTHEIQEQFRKQVHGEAVGPAHASGIAAEERAAGATRGRESARAISTTTLEITVPFTYPDGRIVEVIFRVTNGNVTSVRRRTRRTP